MGSGSGAAEESRLVQAILQKLLRNDFGIDLTMQLLNVLLMVNSKENFAAIDLVIFNLSDGCVKFLKAAAAPSYIKRVREIKQVEVASLPVGIIYSDLGESGCLELKLSGDDYLVLVSDGIEDMKEIKYAPSDREGWFIRYLRHMEEKSPEEMAKSIVEEALRLCNGRPDDDLSVAVISLKKNTAAK
jgi:stage II sporulation protein E